MARLDDLSTELILDILGRIPPEDLESTTSISKTVYPIASTLLDQHRQVLIQQYQVWNDIVKLSRGHLFYHCRHLHASLVCTVLADRRLSRMVKTLKSRNFKPSYTTESDKDPERTWKPDDLFPGSLPGLRKSRRLAGTDSRTHIRILEEALCQCIPLTRDQRETWLKKLHEGSEELATILLLWHLPALRYIHLQLRPTEWTDIHTSLLQIVDYAVTASAPPTSALACAEVPLQHLKEVVLVFEKSRFEDIALIRSFLSLPRLVRLTCEKLSVSVVRKATLRRLATRSAMDLLEFRDCELDMAGLLGSLEAVTAVTRFNDIWHRTEISDPYDWMKSGPSAVVAALVGSIGHRLETLELRAWSCVRVPDINTSMPLRDFPALKCLVISTNILLAKDGSNLSSFAFTLPERLQQLTLYWIKLAPVPDILTFSKSLNNFADLARNHMMLLRNVTLYGYFDVGEIEELPTENKETGDRTIGHLELSIRSNKCYR